MQQDDRILLFLMRIRRRVPFDVLAIHFGVSGETAFNYYYEMLDLFTDKVTPLLLRPYTATELTDMTPPDFKADLPGALFIVDATGFRCKSREDVLLARILYSSYHHQPEANVLLGENSAFYWLSVCAPADRSLNLFSHQSERIVRVSQQNFWRDVG